MRAKIGVIAAVLLGGCSSVDQVPLVYVSTAKVGLNVESGSAETPGASIMIGVDLTDAAYVPVAVARRCDQTTIPNISDCVDEQIKIWSILGTSTDITENLRENLLRLSRTADDLKRDLTDADREYFAALEDERKARADLSRAREAADLVARLEKQAENAADFGLQFAQQEELEEARELSRMIDSYGREVESKVTKRRDARTKLTGIVDQFNRLSGQINGLLNRAEGTKTDQKDALSVYGRFDGDIGGKAGAENSASVGLGKVFSTGIAAQNLTRGIKEAEAAIGTARCINAAVEAHDRLAKLGKDAELPKLVQLCGMRVKSEDD